jgi:hypothetical protein
MDHKVKWKAVLNNGVIAIEGEGDYCENNDISPWQRLEKFVIDNNLEIVDVSLFTANGQTFCLPTHQNRPRVKAFERKEQNASYVVLRTIAREADVTRDNNNYNVSKDVLVEHYTILRVYYIDNGHNYTAEVWVNEQNTNNCWFLIK